MLLANMITNILVILISASLVSALTNRECSIALGDEGCKLFINFKAFINGASTVHNSTGMNSCCYGDQMVDKVQADIIMSSVQVGRQKRSIIDLDQKENQKFKWDQPIWYYLDSSLTANEGKILKEAMDNWEKKTCVRFKELDEEPNDPKPFINVTKGDGCTSFVGRVEAQPQKLFLDSTCFVQKWTLVHELGHVLGLWHPHQQEGRDDYVTIQEDNIRDKTQFLILRSSFVKPTDKTYGYDFASLMHYGPKEFSGFPRAETIIPKDPLFKKTIGQRVEISFNDGQLINEHYCKENCAKTKLSRSCMHGGYQNHDDCKSCICPDGWQGQYCEEIQLSKSVGCGGDVEASMTVQSISSPGYGNNPYAVPQYCPWRISYNGTKPIKLRFKGNFGIYCTNDQVCHDWVEIRFRKNDTRLGPRFCCYDKPDGIHVAEVNEVIVVFKAQEPKTPTSQRTGFMLEYFIENNPCEESPCLNMGTCLERGNGFICMCRQNYSGTRCQQENSNPCSSSPCRNGGSCTRRGSSYICVCPNNISGPRCTQIADPCAPSPCLHGGSCTVRVGFTYSCTCPQDYQGRNCETRDVCSAEPCKNGGTCFSLSSRFFCICGSRFRGTTCEIPSTPATSPCDSSPCFDGATCINRGSSFSCTCPRRKTGRTCETSITVRLPCESIPCAGESICVNRQTSSYFCICPEGQTGRHCENTLPCVSSPCAEGSTCINRGSSLFRCSCPPGRTGRTCEGIVTDPCVESPCENMGRCLAVGGKFLCACRRGFGGTTCGQATDACQSSPCANNGRCRPLGSSQFTCVCPRGFTGPRCTVSTLPVDPCLGFPCQNQGICRRRTSTLYTCTCQADFTGRLCENRTPQNPCLSFPCQNQGICRRRTSILYTCTCQADFTGRLCENRKPQRQCGGCNQEPGCVEEACGLQSFYMGTCQQRIRSGSRFRMVEYSCRKSWVLPRTATCCSNARLITVDRERGERKCAVQGWSNFSTCQSQRNCRGCGRRTRQFYSILSTPWGTQVLQSTRQDVRPCDSS